MALLEFARGPGLWISLLVLVLGSAWRIVAILRLGAEPDIAESRGGPVAGALRGILGRFVLKTELRREIRLGAYVSTAYHLGLAVIVFGYLPHIRFVERLTGIAWPALPAAIVYPVVGLTVVALALALIERLADPVRRLLSERDDYISWAAVFLPLLTGMAAVGGWSPGESAGKAPLYPVPIAVHLLSVELLFVWLPFGKLAHVFLVFVSRGITGAAAARRGAAP